MWNEIDRIASQLEHELAGLRDYESESEAWGAEGFVVGGVDSRFQFRARNDLPSSKLFPTNTICLLEDVDASGTATGGTASGTLIAPQVVLTAKHCLMEVEPPCARSASPLTGTWYPRIRVTPGADFSATKAADRMPASPTSQIADSSRFRVDPHLDYGVIILPRPFTRPNRFMMLQPRSDINTAVKLTIAGYPCDKPLGTMWGHPDKVELAGVQANNLFYRIDTCAGQSGGPVWLLGGGDRRTATRLLLGVHTAGPGRCVNDPSGSCKRTGAPVTNAGPDSSDITNLNCGVRITCHVINTILGWCRAARVRGPVFDAVAYRRVCRRS